MQGACACRRPPRCCCHVCFDVPVKLQAGCVEMNVPVAVQGRPSRTPVEGRAAHRGGCTALQLRFVAVRRIKQVYAAPTDP